MRTLFTLFAALLAALFVAGCPSGTPVVTGDAAPPPVDTTSPVDTTPPRVCNPATDCNDGIACTVDECNPAGGCTHRPMDSMCPADMISCTTAQCQLGRGCVQIPDDALCPRGQVCRSDVGCYEVPRCTSENDPRCDDMQDCTVDRCDMATGRCSYETRDAMCDDGRFCNGEERCTPFRGCLLRSVPSCDDGVPCTIDQCNEAMRRCDHLAESRLCDDGRFCNGVETCDAMRGCQPGTAPSCDDGNACTVDTCDAMANMCRRVPRDADGDMHPDRMCGGDDCDDMNPMVHPGAMETCNMRDDNCNGMVDEGVLGPCGNCDMSCRRRNITTFEDPGRRGTEFSAARGGLVVSAMTTVADFLWVPNTAESTLSKWDASMGVEIARYRVGRRDGECAGRCCYEDGCNMISRVAVDSNGDAYVASRGFNFQGSVTKVAADRRDCVDRNGNGMIDTATGAMPLPYGQDECVLWNMDVGPRNAILRSLVVDRGDAMFTQGYPWVGSYNNVGQTPTFYRLNPRTGEVLNRVPLTFRPYGAVVTADGRLWFSGLEDPSLQYIDTTSAMFTQGPRVDYPVGMRRERCGNAYGITADNRGRIWLAGWVCGDALGFDPRTGQWTRVDTISLIDRVPGRRGRAGRGITADATGRIYMAHSVRDDDGSGVLTWESDQFIPGGNISPFVVRPIAVPAGHDGPSGIGVDRSGNLWLAHFIGPSQLVRYTPSTSAIRSFTGPNRAYTYSDFTGSVRRTVIGNGTFEQDFDTGCANPELRDLLFDAETPMGTSVSFAARSAATAMELGTAMSTAVGVAPRDSSPLGVGAALMRASLPAQRFVRLTLTLQASERGVSPVVRTFGLVWACP